MKVIIIGGVAGGASAAARLRRLDEKAEIVIYERTGFISYANCGLPYYIGEVIKEESNLTLQTPESFFRRFNINVNVNHEVIDINPKEKIIKVKNLLTGLEFIDNYDKLIISTGATPNVPDYYIEDERIFTLRTVEDTLRIKEYVDNHKPHRAIIIGGGFVGLEMAENLKGLGMDVTVIERNNQLLSSIDYDMSSFLHSYLRSNGINLVLNTNIKELSVLDKEITVNTLDNCAFKADLVLVSTGVKPESYLAKKAGLKLGIKGSIKVNSKMETSVSDIYAVGDVVELKHYITKEETVVSLAGPANKEGRIAADNIYGINSEYKGSQNSSIIKIFDLIVATTGINETQAKINNIAYEKIILSPLSHASYYPDSKLLTIKFLFRKDTLDILGAQILGYDGVDKRIDVIATAIRGGLKATDLKDLDLAYAPPFSSAKDPINMIGFIADNIESGIVKQFYYEDIKRLRGEDVILLDTRTIMEYKRAHAEGFMNIPVDDLRNNLHQLDHTKRIYVMCQSGLRSYIATRILVQNGFDAYNFAGGFRLYNSIFNEELLAKTSYPCGMEL